MAVKNFWILDAVAPGGGDFGNMQEDGIAPATATFSLSQGWNVGQVAINNYADMDRGAQHLRGTLDATYGWRTTAPNNPPAGARGNAFRSPSPLTGNFAAANWTLNMIMRSSSGTAQRGAIRASIWRGPNADGTGAVQVGAVAESAATVAPSTTNTTPHTVTLAPGAFSLNEEYLFFVITWRITTVGTANANNWIFSLGSGVVTADFAAVTPTVTVNMTGHDEADEGFGLPTISNPAPLQTVSMTGFGEDEEGFGLPMYLLRSQLTGYAETEVFGATSFALRASPSGFAEDEEAFGSPAIRLTAVPQGYAETEGFGNPYIALAGWTVLLDWDDNTEIDFDHYNVYRSLDEDGPYTQVATGLTTSTHIDDPVARNTIYWYEVSAVDFAGNESVHSDRERVEVDLDLVEVRPLGVDSAQAFGSAAVRMSAYPSSVAPARSYGSFLGTLRINPLGYLETESFGSLAAVLRALPTGYLETEAFGSITARLTALLSGYLEEEGFGSPEVRIPPPVMTVSMLGFLEAEGFGLPAIVPGQFINMTGLGPSEFFGSPVARLIAAPDSLLGVSGYGNASVRLSTLFEGFLNERAIGEPGVALQAILEGLEDHDPGYGDPSYLLALWPEGYLEPVAFGSFGVFGDINVPIWKPHPLDNQLQIVRPTGDLRLLVGPEGRVALMESATGRVVKVGPALSRLRKLEVPSGTVREE